MEAPFKDIAESGHYIKYWDNFAAERAYVVAV